MLTKIGATIRPFNRGIRAMERSGEPWFVGKDAALALGYERPGNALACFVKRADKDTAIVSGSAFNTMQNAIIINVAGLKSLIAHRPGNDHAD